MSKKKETRVVVTGKPRPAIDVDAMTQIIIAFGRELAERKGVGREPSALRAKVVGP